jgi:hypothetical protein
MILKAPKRGFLVFMTFLKKKIKKRLIFLEYYAATHYLCNPKIIWKNKLCLKELE